MTNTLPSKNEPNATQALRKEAPSACSSTSGRATDIGLALITPIVGQEFLDSHNLRDPLNRGLQYGVKQVFSAAGASTRQFKRIQGLGKAPTRLKASGADYFDLTPDDDQKMIVETVERVRRGDPAARRPRRRRRRDLPAGPDRQGRRTGHHRDQHPRGFRRHRRAPLDGHQRARRRGAGLRRHGTGAADPRARRRRVGAHPLGQRRPAGHLPARSSPARTSRRPAWRSPNRTRCSTRPR